MKIAVLADVHANVHALDTVLEETSGVCEEYWFLGDLVGYGPHAVQCVERMSTLAERRQLQWIAGNHDLALHGGDGRSISISDFYYPASYTAHLNFRQMERQPRRMRWHMERSRPEDAGPKEFRGGSTLCVGVHASLQEPVRSYVHLEAANMRILQREFTNLRALAAQHSAGSDGRVCLFLGHTHRPGFVWAEHTDSHCAEVRFECNDLFRSGTEVPLTSALFIINPGSVGQPRDGDPRASFLILDTEKHTVQLRRVMYPIRKTIEDMRTAGFPEDVREFLGDWLCLGEPPGYRPGKKPPDRVIRCPEDPTERQG